MWTYIDRYVPVWLFIYSLKLEMSLSTRANISYAFVCVDIFIDTKRVGVLVAMVRSTLVCALSS